MEIRSQNISRLFHTTTVENKDDLDEKLERSYQFFQSIVSGLSDKDAHEALNRALTKEKGYEDVSLGLLVSILTDPNSASKSYRDLTLITRDGFGLILINLTQLINERYLKFNETVKVQLIWLLREMIKNSVNGVDNLCWNLMRHAAGGDVSLKNITLIESLLDVFIEYRNWLDKYPFLIASIVYNYLRLIEDHHTSTPLISLRNKEVEFVVSLLREKFTECLIIGRDLIRLLQNVARIPEFELFWKDLLLQPKSLSANFNGILQLLQTRTSRRFLQSRLTPEMEKKLVFLTSQVRFGNHKRYQDWFQRQYLATPESQSLRCDIIRFIVGVIHPTNELLCSDIIPRWAVIGWLLTTCTSAVAVSNAKLALFYDWLFFDSEKDNIMNIEPAILVMHHSMRSHPAVSATLLDFLCRIINNFYPPLTDKVRNGIFCSLRQILDKRVLSSLLPLFDNAKLDRELRNMVKDTFREFFNSTSMVMQQQQQQNDGVAEYSHENSIGGGGGGIGVNHINNLSSGGVTLGGNEPEFSDDDEDDDSVHLTINPPLEDDTDDDDIPLSEVRLKKIIDKDDSLIEGPLGETLSNLHQESDIIKRCVIMDSLVNQVKNLESDDENLTLIARSICNAIKDDFNVEIFPLNSINDTALMDSIKLPLFVMYKHLYVSNSSTNGKETLLKLISEMSQHLDILGYLLLYYLKVQIRTENKREDQTKASALKIGVYKEYCQYLNKKIEQCLYDDLEKAHVINNKLMMWIIPDLYRDFKQQTVNNAQILRVILSSVDTRQFQTLLGKVLQGHLVMFKSENILPLLRTSLNWESIEQLFLWQLIDAHDITIDTILPLVSNLDYDQHSEALTAITLMLKQEKPNADYIKTLFSRELNVNGDLFIFTIVKYWCDEYIDKVAELISSLLSTRYPSTSPNKRKRNATSSGTGGGGGSNSKNQNNTSNNNNNLIPSSDHVLGHLEQLRVICERHDCMAIYTLDSMQRALNIAHVNSTENQKKQFNELFALMEEEEEISSTTKRTTHGRGRKPAAKPPPVNKRTIAKDLSGTSEESSEEEEIVKPKQAKKRKKVISDSD